ncbi:hypothetical protein HK097_008144 [Rhizophlyctis rosea]|uniref:Sterol regulatory element-binding protein cleavage-activating protein n=1 Tax=Rhizophlyctis rosea TaxID=64517 RepID=A0AAD5SIH7_9FUNG|nr:hypothetical protein HK097_008144 [Rhizophlyctis rosea]
MLRKVKAVSKSVREAGRWVESYLSQLFYRHGILCASYPYISLALSFALIFFLSYPVVDQARTAFLTSHAPDEYVKVWDTPSTRAPWREEQFRSSYGDQPLFQLEQVLIRFEEVSDRGKVLHGIGDNELKILLDLQQKLLNVPIPQSAITSSTSSRVVRQNTPGISIAEADPTNSPLAEGSVTADSANKWRTACFVPHGRKDCFMFGPSENDFSVPRQTTLPRSTIRGLPDHVIYGNLHNVEKDAMSADSVIVSLAWNKTSVSGSVDFGGAWDNMWVSALGQLEGALYAGRAIEGSYQVRREVGETEALYHKSYSRGTLYKGEALLLSASYLIVFLYISLVVGRVDLVKSKFALGFGAVFAVVCSMLMSVGLCSMLGIQTSLVPWEVLPFLIIAVGVENIFVLTNAVVMTSLDLPVKERVGLGLARVGVPMLATLGWEMAFLLLGSSIDIPALQEFCLFGAVSIVIDYFMQITFFATILSIDIRRLELSELHKLRKVQIAQELQAAREVNNASAGIAATAKKHIPWRAWLITLAFMCLLGFGLHGTHNVEPSSAHAEKAATTIADILWNVTNTDKAERYILVSPPLHITIFLNDNGTNAANRTATTDATTPLLKKGPFPSFNTSILTSASIFGAGTLTSIKQISPALLTALVVALLLFATVCFVIVTSTLYSVTRTSATFPQFHWTHAPTGAHVPEGGKGEEVWKSGRCRVLSLKASGSMDVKVLTCDGNAVGGEGGVVAWSCLDGRVCWWDAEKRKVKSVTDGCRKRKRVVKGANGVRKTVDVLVGLTVGERGGVLGGSSLGGWYAIWDANSGEGVAEIAEPEVEGANSGDDGQKGKPLMKLMSTPIGRQFVVTSAGSSVSIRELVTGPSGEHTLLEETIRFSTTSAVSLLYSDARGRLYAGCMDGSIFCWAPLGEASSVEAWWKVFFTFVGHRSPVTTLKVDNNVGLLVAGTRDGFVYVWDVEARMRLISIPPRSAALAKAHATSTASGFVQAVTSIVLLRVGETFASSTYTLAVAYASEMVRFYEVTLSLEGDEGRSIPSVRRRSSTPRKDSISGMTGLDDVSPPPPQVPPWKVEVNLVKQMEQSGCVVIGSYLGAVVGCRRRLRKQSSSSKLGTGGNVKEESRWWELWIAEVCDGDDMVRLVRGIWLGRDEIGGKEDIVVAGGNIAREEETSRFSQFFRKRSTKPTTTDGKTKAEVDWVETEPDVDLLPQRSADINNDGSPDCEGDSSDSDDCPLPILKVELLVAGSWGVAVGFGNFVKIILFESSDGELAEVRRRFGNGLGSSKLHAS